MTIRRKLLNFGTRSTDLRFGCGAFSELSKMLAGAVGRPCRAFMIADTELDEALLVQVRRSLIDAGYRVDELMLDGLEAARFTSVSRAYERLAAAGITSEDLVLGVGPAAVCSLAAFASHGWCGGTSCALIPTTLDAMVRLPTQMEPLSVAGDAHAVSVSPQVSLVVCDLNLVVGRDVDANGMGYVLICAAHLAESRKCWEGFAGTVEGLAQHGEIAFIDAICTAQTSRLNTAKSASPSARRAFMYGQTTARALSACLGDAAIQPYRLYAEGMRFEARLAVDVCDFSVDEMFAQDDHLEDLGIEELSFALDADAFIAALRAERFRRANRFQLALPKHPGIIRLSSVEDEVLERHARAFLASRRP